MATFKNLATATLLSTRTLPTPQPAARTQPPPATSPTAAVAPAPVPARPFNYAFVPPLSIEEAKALIRVCMDILAISDPPTQVSRCQKVWEIIEATINYLTALDQRRTTLADYEWHFIDREKVDGPGRDRDEFRAQPLIGNVSAISFAADFGDVFIYSVEVLDSSGNMTTFTLDRLVEENYPHQEICYLFFPKKIQSVFITYQPRGTATRTPRLAVYAGVARQEEYLKQTLWYLRQARREVGLAIQEPPATGVHVDAAVQNLRHAASRLIRFRMKSVF